MKKSIEETSKKEIAKKVMTPKRRYFAPSLGRSVEARDLAEAEQLINDSKKDNEAGDDNS